MNQCRHGNLDGNCRECQIENIQEKKQAKKPTPIKALKNRSRDQEREVAKSYKAAGFQHAKRQAMSGALATLKADVDPGELLLVECKLTRSGRLVIDPEWLAKVHKESQDVGRAGFFALHGWMAEGGEHYHKVVVVDEALWMSVIGAFKNAEGN